jgi:hypothetical protein
MKIKLIIENDEKSEMTATNIDELQQMANVLRRLIKSTFINEYCIGCTLGLSFPSGKCRGCKALEHYGLTLQEVQS